VAGAGFGQLGHWCRCGTYPRIRAAIMQAAKGGPSMIPSDNGRTAGTGLVDVSRRGSGAQQQGEKKFGADGLPNGWRDDPKIFVALSEDGSTDLAATVDVSLASMLRLAGAGQQKGPAPGGMGPDLLSSVKVDAGTRNRLDLLLIDTSWPQPTNKPRKPGANF
jgi:hypothetical protein